MFRRKTPASKLSNSELQRLDHLFALVDRGTSDLMIHPVKACNEKVISAINEYPNETMVYEVVRRIRKKLKSNNNRVVLLSLHLSDELMKNCTAHVRREIGGDKFMAMMSKICKLQRAKADYEGRDISLKAQDLVQDWAIGPSSLITTGGSNNNIVATYDQLRKEGIIFKGSDGKRIMRYGDYSTSRPREFSDNSSQDFASRLQGGIDEESAMAEALASSAKEMNNGNAESFVQEKASKKKKKQKADEPIVTVLSMVTPSIETLLDILLASQNLAEIEENDILDDIVKQCIDLKVTCIKEAESTGIGETRLAQYLKAHDDLDNILNLYNQVVEGKLMLPMDPNGGWSKLVPSFSDSSISSLEDSPVEKKTESVQNANKPEPTTGNLLDFDEEIVPSANQKDPFQNNENLSNANFANFGEVPQVPIFAANTQYSSSLNTINSVQRPPTQQFVSHLHVPQTQDNSFYLNNSGHSMDSLANNHFHTSSNRMGNDDYLLAAPSFINQDTNLNRSYSSMNYISHGNKPAESFNDYSTWNTVQSYPTISTVQQVDHMNDVNPFGSPTVRPNRAISYSMDNVETSRSTESFINPFSENNMQNGNKQQLYNPWDPQFVQAENANPRMPYAAKPIPLNLAQFRSEPHASMNTNIYSNQQPVQASVQQCAQPYNPFDAPQGHDYANPFM